MSNVILKGDEALHYAAVHHVSLNKYATDTEPAREGLSHAEASKIALERPGLIWLEAHIKLNSADPSEQE